MVRCQIKGCEYSKSVRFKPQNGTTFHHFPPDPVRREVWCQLIRLHSDASFKPIMQPRLCSAHFRDDDFKYTAKGMRYLKKTAIPRISRYCSPSLVVKSDVGSNTVRKRVDSDVGNGRENICRACRCSGASEHMFNTGSELAHLYTECTSLKAGPGDGLSQYICEACRNKLIYISEFRKNCIYSYNALMKKVLQEHSSSDSTSTDNVHSQLPTFEVDVTENSEYSDHEYSRSDGSADGFITLISNLKDIEKDEVQRATSTEKSKADKIIVKCGQNYQRTFPAFGDSENNVKMDLKETNDIFKEKLKVKEILKHEARQINKMKTNTYCYTQEQKYIHEKVPANATAKEQDETVCKVEFLEHNTFKEHVQSHSFADSVNVKDHTNTIAKENVEIVCKVEYLNHDTLEHLQSHSFADIENLKDQDNATAKEQYETVCKVEFVEHDIFKEHLQRQSFADNANLKDRSTTTKKNILPNMTCPVCKAKFQESTTFEEHLQSHSFVDIENLEDHANTITKGSDEIVCKVEYLKHDTLEHLQSHNFADIENLTDQANTTKKYTLPNMTCPVCKAKFQDSTIFEEHLRSHKFKEICVKGMTKSSKQVQTKHVRGKKKILPLECRICNRVMKDRETLRQHKKISHTKKRRSAPNNSGETDICHICGKTVAVKNYQNHIRSCTNEKQFACKVCNKKFNTQVLVNGHMILHREKKYFCDYCQKGFTGRQALILHVRTHIGWRVSCTICGKSFSSHTMHAIHRRIHTGERPYRCDVCNKGYICKNNLDRHKTTHSSERPIQCQYCGNKYKEKNSLRRHLKTQCKIKLRM